MSRVHRVRGGYLAEWAMCVRNDDASKRQHYTFYFKNRKISEWRLSAIVEGCETREPSRPCRRAVRLNCVASEIHR